MTENAKNYICKLYPDAETSSLAATDPEFYERFTNFAYDEVVHSDEMDGRTRMIVVLAALMGCQGYEKFRVNVSAALNMGVSVVEIKEIVYQGTAYLGMGRAYPFLKIVNEEFTKKGICLPLEPQARNTVMDREETGDRVMCEICGDGMHEFWKKVPQLQQRLSRWVTTNCFGDYYTRGGLNYAERELITFCFIAAQGGCEPQLISHAGHNMRNGNDKGVLSNVVAQMCPYIGYPRSLNAMRCVFEAAKKFEAQ